jgi:hypothetical protein
MLSVGMTTEDIRSLSQIGNALWVDRDLSRQRTAETLQAVSLLSLPEDALLERASSALLARATREDLGARAAFLGDPFFRLLPEERFILVALHLERWSYERVARVLGCTAEQVATRAWKVRVHLASQPLPKSQDKGRASGAGPRAPPVLGAVGTSQKGASCPEFQSLNPWTQRFLDEEHATRERVFLQNHLMACDDCRLALARCRELYFHVEKMIPRTDGDSAAELSVLARQIAEVRRRTRPELWSWGDALHAFLRRPEVQIFTSLALAWLLYRLL